MKWILPLILFSTCAHAYNKDFKLVNDRAPHEFKVLFESMRNSLRDPVEEARLVAYCSRIDKGLAPLKRDQSMLLLKTEIYKTLLEWKFSKSDYRVTNKSLDRIKTNLTNDAAIYTPFSKWVIETMMADLEGFRASGELDTAESVRNRSSGDENARQITKILTYTREWLHKADTLTAQNFNELTQKASWMILQRVREKALLFQELSSKAVQVTEEKTFNIPQIDGPAKPTPAPALGGSTDVGAQSESNKAQATQSLKPIDVKPSDIPAEDLSNAIDKISPDTKAAPKDQGSGAQDPLE